MSRSHPPLQQHLLTRSDLAQLGVPAGDILAWLARGAIEQVGTLAGEAGDDPVFTAAPELRADLSARLATIGKPTVVLSPMRVRSFLLRALMQRHGAAPAPAAATNDDASPQAALAEHLATTDLAQVLHEAVNELEADFEQVLRIAEDEARLEASIGVAAAESGSSRADLTADSSHERVADEAADEEGLEGGDGEACFDVDDLASALGEWDDEPSPKPNADEDEAAIARPAESEVAASGDGEAEVRDESPMEPDAPAAIAEADATAATTTTISSEHGSVQAARDPGEEAATLETMPATEPATPGNAEAVGLTASPSTNGAVLPEAPHVDDVIEHEPEVATASPAATTREEPTMSAEPMATEAEVHPAPEQVASDAIAGAEQALEPLLHDEDQPPTFDAKEIAAALSVLDLDSGPMKPSKVAVEAAAPRAAEPAAAEEHHAAAARSDEPASSRGEVAEETAATPAPTTAETPSASGPEAPATVADAVAAETPPVVESEPVTKEPEAPAAVAGPTPTSNAAMPTSIPVSTPTPDVSAPVMVASMQRVEAFLGELKAALVEMAGRPVPTPPPPTIQVPPASQVDLAPLVGAIEGGLQKSTASSAATTAALTGLAEKLDGIGQRIERSAVAAESMAQHANAPKSTTEPARFLVQRSNPLPLMLLAVAAMVTAWSVLFWFKTGSPRLALGTLVGANLVGCVLLTPGRLR